MISPADIWKYRGKALGPMVVDTETSGLYPDSGARCAIVSAAWMVSEPDLGLWTNLGAHTNWEPFLGDAGAWIASTAWPFDQGVDGKEELFRSGAKRGLPGKGKGQPSVGQEVIWPDAPNQPWHVWRGLLKIMRLWHHGLVFHNAKFDQHILRAGVRRERWGYIGDELTRKLAPAGVERGWEGWAGDGVDLSSRTKWDTQIVAKRLWPMATDPKTGFPTSSLKPTAERLWGVQEGDLSRQVKDYLQKAGLPAGRWDLIPWDIIGPYADQDARLTLRLLLRQQAEIEAMLEEASLDTRSRIARDLATMQMLYRQEVRGVPFPWQESEQWAKVLDGRAAELAARLPFTPATLPAAKDYYFSKEKAAAGKGLGLEPYSETDTGAPQMTAQVVLRMQRDGVPDISTWADLQKVSTAASMWYRGYAELANRDDGRLRTCYRQVARGKEGDGGTRSTRFSVERVNLQAIPQNYRLDGFACLDGVPSPRDLIAMAVPDGWTEWELDLAQAELRVGALMSGCEPMLRMMRQGQDLHAYTTKALFPKINEKSVEWPEMRQVGKKGNFSLGFGAGGETFGDMIAKETGIYLGDREANRIVKRWNALYPQWGRAIETHSRRVALRQERMGHGWVVLANGERRWFAEYEDTHKAFNQRVQGSLAQFGIEWALQTEHYLHDVLQLDLRGEDAGIGGAGLLLLIHDSQVLLLPSAELALEDEDGAPLPPDAEIAQRCVGFGAALWTSWFAEVPGGPEAKQWKAHIK